MAILSKTEFLKRLETIVGEDASDETLSLIEDFTDTYNDLETKSNNNAVEEWQNKYNDLSRKYKERFFTPQEPSQNTSKSDIPTPPEEEPNQAEEITINDLFNDKV